MIANPFLMSDKIVAEYFCDRKDESQQLVKYLTNGNNVVLMAERRIGKTALIQYCYDKEEIKKNFITIYVDILSTNNLQEFVYLIGKEIYSSLMPWGMKVLQSFINGVKSMSGKLGFDPTTGLPTLNLQLGDIREPQFSLDEIFRFLEATPKKCIIAIDEFQQIANYPEKNVEALLRSHIQRLSNCRFIFSGSSRHLLQEMFLSYARPFYQSATIIDLKPIPSQIYIPFIEEMFSYGDRIIPRELATLIYNVYDGVTFYIQRVCNNIFSNSTEGEIVNIEMIISSVKEILFSYDTLFRERLSQLAIRQKELLLAIAAQPNGASPTSGEFIRNHSLQSSSSVQSALRSLVKTDIVIRRENKYYLSDKFLNQWININFNNLPMNELFPCE